MLKNILKLLRIKQWIKNSFVFAPIIFSKHLLEFNYLFNSILAFFTFCIISSSVYIINDIIDREIDKAHPSKKNRPIASGIISVPLAITIVSMLLILSFFIMNNLKFNFIVVVFLYFILNIFYSIWFKHIVILDVFSLATGFILRVLAGAIVIDVIASYWLIICTLFVSLFHGFAKRRSEIVMNQNQSSVTTRKVLADYNIPFLDYMLIITASCMAISYSLYTVSERTIREFKTENLIYTTVFVLYAIFRYLYLLIKKNIGEDASQVILSDPPMFIDIFLWLLSCVLLLYKSNIF